MKIEIAVEGKGYWQQHKCTECGHRQKGEKIIVRCLH